MAQCGLPDLCLACEEQKDALRPVQSTGRIGRTVAFRCTVCRWSFDMGNHKDTAELKRCGVSLGSFRVGRKPHRYAKHRGPAPSKKKTRRRPRSEASGSKRH